MVVYVRHILYIYSHFQGSSESLQDRTSLPQWKHQFSTFSVCHSASTFTLLAPQSTTKAFAGQEKVETGASVHQPTASNPLPICKETGISSHQTGISWITRTYASGWMEPMDSAMVTREIQGQKRERQSKGQRIGTCNNFASLRFATLVFASWIIQGGWCTQGGLLEGSFAGDSEYKSARSPTSWRRWCRTMSLRLSPKTKNFWTRRENFWPS